MRLFNHTKIDSDILKKVILEAAKSIGMAPKTRHVPIRVTTAKGWTVSGMVYRGREVSSYFMNQRQGYRHKGGITFIKADGIMTLKVPIFGIRDYLDLAETFFAIAAHEWRHIRDCQKGRRFDSKDVLYWNRCQEIRARKSERLAETNLHKSVSAQEAVLNLAVNLEELAEKRERKHQKSHERKMEKAEDVWAKTAHGIKSKAILTRIAIEAREVYG